MRSMPGSRAEAGSRPAASVFLLLRQKKGTKEKATLLSATPSLRCGATWGARARGVPQNSLRACSAPFRQLRQVRARRRVSCGTRPPRPLRAPGASRRDGGPNSHTGHCCARPHLAGASATRCAFGAEQRDGPCGCLDVRLSTPCWLRLRRGGCGVSMRVGARMLRVLTRRSCLSGAPQARSEFCGAPRNRPDAGCPAAQRRGRRLGVALSLVTFFRRRERKLPRRRARTPAPALHTSTPPNQRAREQHPGFDKLNPNGRGARRPNFDRPSPACAARGACARVLGAEQRDGP